MIQTLPVFTMQLVKNLSACVQCVFILRYLQPNCEVVANPNSQVHQLTFNLAM